MLLLISAALHLLSWILLIRSRWTFQTNKFEIQISSALYPLSFSTSSHRFLPSDQEPWFWVPIIKPNHQNMIYSSKRCQKHLHMNKKILVICGSIFVHINCFLCLWEITPTRGQSGLKRLEATQDTPIYRQHCRRWFERTKQFTFFYQVQGFTHCKYYIVLSTTYPLFPHCCTFWSLLWNSEVKKGSTSSQGQNVHWSVVECSALCPRQLVWGKTDSSSLGILLCGACSTKVRTSKSVFCTFHILSLLAHTPSLSANLCQHVIMPWFQSLFLFKANPRPITNQSVNPID